MYGDKIAAHTEKLVRDIQNELTVAIERRFGELMGRLDAILPDNTRRAEKTFRFSSERDDGEIVDLPNPLGVVRKTTINRCRPSISFKKRVVAALTGAPAMNRRTCSSVQLRWTFTIANLKCAIASPSWSMR
ncbi:MAG TPA: hypothetical protein VM910_10655 [Bradyrhizobium sp.]|jgi:hypothetical protein|nr:hypothetical protein [Bradyrhizobium sp.]